MSAMVYNPADFWAFYQTGGTYEYLFLRTHFVFLADSEPLIFFFIDYLAIMGLFVFIGHYLAGWLKRLDKKGSSK